MTDEILDQIQNGIITEEMEIHSLEYQDFKLLIRSKVAITDKSDRIHIALLGLKFQMEDYLHSNDSLIQIGEFIKRFLEAIETKQSHFAKYIG